MKQNYETISFDCARKFLDAIRRSNARWLRHNASLTPWVFRGQGNSEWDLTPSAWRPAIELDDRFQKTLATISDNIVDSVFEVNRERLGNIKVDRDAVRHQVAHRRFEFLQVQAFTSLADDLGLHVPGGFVSHKISRELVPDESLFVSLHPAYALAQHHGMATRLLDWTLNPLVAAFFAAENPDGELAVWALNVQALFDTEWIDYRVPRSQIGFLHSQAGLFTYHSSADASYVVCRTWPMIEQICSPALLKKLLLPSSEAKELRRLLYVEGISKAHLMPTFDNIKETLKVMWQ